jgi:mannose-1-phosphate guanylyltransferase
MEVAQVERQIERCFSDAEVPGDARWAIVLSGGEGANTWRQVNSYPSGPRPRQYCKFADGRTPIEQTLDRATSMVPWQNVLTVIGRAHQKYLVESRTRPLPGSLIEQPLNLGTALGIMLPATFVSEIDPDATLIILPADHFVHPEELFLQHAARAVALVEEHPDRLILVGVPADRPETQYGWIVPEPGQDVPSAGIDDPPLLRVKHFREKPGYDEAIALMREDALWSTMVIVVKVKALWTLLRTCLPDLMTPFDAFRQILRAVREGEVEPLVRGHALSDLYEKLRPVDFSKEILEHPRAHGQLSVMPMLNVTWADWGRSKHLTESLARLDGRANS